MVNNKTLCAITIAYNSADYLDYVIRSAMKWVDHMIVIEGAFQITIDAGAAPRSSDGTLGIISKYHESTNKQFIGLSTETPLREHRDQYDFALQTAKAAYKPDWVVLIDSDEIYPIETQKLLRSVIDRVDDKIFGMRMYSYNFINDVATYYNGCYPRLYRVTPNSKFSYDNKVDWPDYGLEGDNMQHPAPQHILTIPKTFRFYHYAYVKDHNYLNLKAKYMYNKDGNPSYHPSNPLYRVEGDKYKIPDDITLYNFTGRHPDIMKDHPRFSNARF